MGLHCVSGEQEHLDRTQPRGAGCFFGEMLKAVLPKRKILSMDQDTPSKQASLHLGVKYDPSSSVHHSKPQVRRKQQNSNCEGMEIKGI